MAPNVELEADHLRNKARKELLGLLEGVRGKKNLVISRDLTGPIGLFVTSSVLQDYGVDKFFVLENGNTDSSQRNIVYLVHGESAATVQAVAEQVKKIQRNGSVEHEISIFWVPRRTLVSNKILEDEGVLGDVNISELPLTFLPLENDLLSLELADGFGDLYLRHDPTPIYLASRALMEIQKRHGLFPRILGKGDNARKLASLLLRGRKELDVEETSTLYATLPSTSIEQLVVIDRDVDFATVLLTQLTYEGLIDELVGIKHNLAEVDSSIVGSATSQRPVQGTSSSTSPPPTARQSMKRKILLDSSDVLYAQIRSSNFASIGPTLNKIARRLAADYEGRHSDHIAELREFVNKFQGYQKEHQSLMVHTNLADDLSKQTTRSDTFRQALEVQQNLAAGVDPTSQHPAIEELIARGVPLATVLRLLCLESTLAGGLRPRDLESFKRHVLHAYGFQHLLTLARLEKMELLQARSGATALILPVGGGVNLASSSSTSSSSGTKTNYAYLRKELVLVVDEFDGGGDGGGRSAEDAATEPTDAAYVFSGYAPLSMRLVQSIVAKASVQALRPTRPLALTPSSHGWMGFEDMLKSARGPTFTIAQRPADEKAARARAALGGGGGPGSPCKTVVVMFLGGITFAEVAALRWLARKLDEQQGSARRRIVICTTGIVSGRSVMEGVIEKGTL